MFRRSREVRHRPLRRSCDPTSCGEAIRLYTGLRPEEQEQPRESCPRRSLSGLVNLGNYIGRCSLVAAKLLFSVARARKNLGADHLDPDNGG